MNMRCYDCTIKIFFFNLKLKSFLRLNSKSKSSGMISKQGNSKWRDQN